MLVNLPLRDQLAEPGWDGTPDENARANCVAASLASVVSLYTGQAHYGDEMHDKAYYEGFLGGTSPMHYAAVLESFGIRIVEVVGDATKLTQTIIDNLKAGQAVVGAIPSQWGLDYSKQDMVNYPNSTHEIAFCDYDGTNLTAMNPWPVDGQNAFYQKMPVSWWAQRLVYGHVHVLVKENATVAWTKTATGGTDAKGHTCGQGVMDYLTTHALTGSDGKTSEIFYDANNAFLVLENQHVVTVLHKSDGSWQIDERGGDALVNVWNMVETLQAQLKAKAAETAAPPELRDLTASLSNLLAPFVSVGEANAALMKKMGY